WKAQSEAFGAAGIIQSQTTIEMNLRFPGQYYDEETGTHYNFHRDYKPNLGRYLQSDPIGLKAGVNLFAYVDLRPLIWMDSLGLKSQEDAEESISDWVKKNACKKGCDWLYKKCRETWMRYCVMWGRSTACAEFCELQVPDLCAQEREKHCPDPVACVTPGDYPGGGDSA
ncbi:RHS repeat-associated core domain-containing protein, partial [Comamonadaceae bacterium OH2545_COT-014]